MKQLRRGLRRILQNRRSAFLAGQDKAAGRILRAEHLEGRAMMAADLGYSPYWNGSDPTDVNKDGTTAPLDALIVINELNSGGTRNVRSGTVNSTGAEGEQNQGGLYYDVDNDGYVSPIDALIVINSLNAEGEGETDQVRYVVRPVAIADLDNNGFLDDVITTINEGELFDLQVLVQDRRQGGGGVFAGYLDVLTDTSKLDIFVYETQHISLTGDPVGGSFTLTFNGQTTQPIAFNGTVDGDQVATAAVIKQRLEALPGIGAGNVDVAYEPLRTSPQDPNPSEFFRWNVRFVGNLADTDVPTITGNAAGLTGGTNPQVSVTVTANGVDSDPDAVREAFRSPNVFKPGVFSYPNGLSGAVLADRFDDIGAFGGLSATGFNTQHELVRVRLRATDGGVLTFQGNVTSVLDPQHRTSVYGSNVPIEFNRIGVYSAASPSGVNSTPAQLTVVEKVTAANDTATTNEDVVVNIPVLSNDSTQQGSLRIQSINLTGTQGTAVVNDNGTPANLADDFIRFTPSANFNGTTTFTYTAADGLGNSDVGTVTVTVNSVNDAPIISLPVGVAGVEDTPLTLGGSSAISVTDPDATGNLVVTLAASQGTLSLATIAGLENVTGNGTGSISFQGTVAEVNTALNGMVYSPPSNFNGQVTIGITTNDQGSSGGPAQSDNKSLVFTVSAVNDPPTNTLPLTTLTVVEEEDLVFSGVRALSVADVDAGEGVPPTVRTTLSVNPSFATLNVVAVGHGANVTGSGSATVVIEGTIAQVNAALVNLTYRPNDGVFDQIDTLTMVTTDLGHTGSPGAQTDTDTVQIEIESAILPRARRDDAIVVEGSSDNPIFVLENDRANAGQQPVLVSVPANSANGGTLSINDNGTPDDDWDDFIQYTPAPDFFGLDTFTYVMNETGGAPASDFTGTVEVVVTNTPDAPVASDDSYSTDEDTPLNIALPGVLANDTDVDGDTLTAQIVSQPTNGTLTLNANGSFTYTPAANFNGSDSFTYRASDGALLSNVATVNLTINAVNDAPVAQNNSYSVNEDATLNVPVGTGVLANDTDVEGSPLTASLVTQAANGTVTLNADGSFSYQPNLNFFGTDSFTYRASDGSLQSNVATVTITVNPVNDAPVAQPDSYTTNEDTTLNVALAANGVLANDSDVEGTALGVIVASQPSNGTLTMNPLNGTFTYVPNLNFNGTDSFTYRATDGQLQSANVTVTITVNAVNDAPTTGPDSYSGANEDAVVSIDAASGVLNGDTDVDGDTVSAVAETVTSTNGAVVVIAADGSFTYDPRNAANLQRLAAGVTINDSFTYRATDGVGGQSNGTVTISVTGVNDAPDAVNDTANAIANIPQTINVLANDVDIDQGDVLTITGVSADIGIATTNGTTITFTAPAGYSGPATITYSISDGKGGTDTATVAVSVVNFIPTDISGYVYIDRTTSSQPNGNGVFESGERGVANVTITLSSPTGLDMFGNPFTPQTTVTDANGRYEFSDVVPGNFVITQTQPQHLRDGLETVGEPTFASLQANQNNKIFISLPQLGAPDGNVENNNFAELGIDASSLDNSSGLLQEMLASSSQNGLVLSTNLNGDDFWFWALNNWSGLTAINAQLHSSLASMTLTATINGVTKTATIRQEPNSLGGRFRVLGYTNDGGYLIRIDGKASDFQWAATQQSGEGEGEGGDADAGYVDSVDRVLAEQSWV